MQSMAAEQNFLYNDINQLYKMKQHKGSSEGLAAVAQQFESLYMNMMMQSMRNAERIWSEDNPLSSNDVQFYQDMYDNQLSMNLSQKKGLGLADMIVKQFDRFVDSQPPIHDLPEQSSGDTVKKPMQSYFFPMVEKSASTAPELNKVEDLLAEDGNNEPSLSLSIQVKPKQTFANPQDFIDALMPIARQMTQNNGLSPNVLVAQAALETGWGKYPIVTEHGKDSHNLFGIKAGASWQGEKTQVSTTEYNPNDEIPKSVRDEFRVYSDFQSNFADYIDLISNQPRYKKAWEVRSQPKEYLVELEAAGYATDPQYAKKVMSILEGSRFSTMTNTYASHEE